MFVTNYYATTVINKSPKRRQMLEPPLFRKGVAGNVFHPFTVTYFLQESYTKASQLQRRLEELVAAYKVSVRARYSPRAPSTQSCPII